MKSVNISIETLIHVIIIIIHYVYRAWVSDIYRNAVKDTACQIVMPTLLVSSSSALKRHLKHPFNIP